MTSPTGSCGIRAARPSRLDGCGFISASARTPATTMVGQRGECPDRNSSSTANAAGANQLDPVPRHPVSRLGTQALDSEALGQAGGPMDGPRRTQDRETGRFARPRPRSRPDRGRRATVALRSHPAAAATSLVRGPAIERRRSGAYPSRRQNSSLTAWTSSIGLENHQAILRRRTGHGRC